MDCRVGVVKGEALLSYSFPSPHPFTQERVERFWDRLQKESLPVAYLSPQKGGRDLIELFHLREHVDFVEKASRFGYGVLDQGDTPVFKGIFEAAQYTVGSTIYSLEHVMRKDLDHALNPVGGLHHATRDASAGFCVFNDIGVAIEVLRKRFNLRRILYVDIDVHHGDGVYYSYESDPELFIFDMHEDGRYLYPGTGSADETGRGVARGTKVNIPLPPGAGDEATKSNLSKLQEFGRSLSPEFIILQCGADGLDGDPIAGLKYSSATHRMVTHVLHELSHECCSGRLLALGGGGYDPDNCAAGWVSVVRAMLTRTPQASRTRVEASL